MNRRDVLAAAGASAVVAALAPVARADGENISAEAHALYQRAMVFDANLNPPAANDFPFPQSVFDMARQSGVTAMKTTVCNFDAKFQDAADGISFFQYTFEKYPDVYMQIRRHSDFAECKRTGRLGVILSFESVDMLDGKIENIQLFRGLGVRVMQLSYNLTSPFGSGVLADPKLGLTDLGHKAIEAMNKSGVAVDISHANEATSLDVLKASTKPALITHAGCKAVHENPRNKSDAVLRAVADKGGVVGIYDLPYIAASPKQPTLDDYIAHMTHALNVCGEDHVGIGSDSDMGPWDTSPEALKAFLANEELRKKTGVAAPEEDRPFYVIGMNTPRRSEVIADALLKRGYKASAVEKVLGSNFTDALGRIWAD